MLRSWDCILKVMCATPERPSLRKCHKHISILGNSLLGNMQNDGSRKRLDTEVELKGYNGRKGKNGRKDV